MSAGADAFATLALADAPPVKAPDGSDVRPLLSLAGGSLAHFELAAGKTSIAVAHRSVEEIWFVIGGRGEMWRKQAEREEIVALHAGVSLTIPLGTAFQFRSFGPEPLTMVAITMPPWPGEDEAYAVQGKWRPSL
jgi:mannose-6-phosphate isomerase-like protein (cupin superfamily)